MTLDYPPHLRLEMAVKMAGADGGIILTASHNPKEWNALKLPNCRGEFIDAETGARVLELTAAEKFNFAPVDKLGKVTVDDTYMQQVYWMPSCSTCW